MKDSHRLNDIGVPIEPTQPLGETSEVTDDTEQLNTDLPLELTQNSGEATSFSEPEDLWAKAEQRLTQDEKIGRILKEATKIVEESGLKVGSHGIVDHQQFRSFLDAKVDELEQKKWVVQIDDHYIGVRDQLTQVFRNILVVKDIVNAAASASPPVAIVCAGMIVSLLFFIQAVEQQDSLLEGLETISLLIPRLHMIEGLYLHSDASVPADAMESFKKVLILLYCKIVEFQARALCFLRKNSFSQISRNLFKQDPWKDLIKSIKDRDRDAQSFTPLIDTAQRKLDKAKHSQELEQASQKYQVWQITSDRDMKVKRFFNLLYTCLYRDRKDRIDDRVPETCEWLTSHPLFQHWDQNDNSCLLWVSADPGCGKSVLSKYLIDEVLRSVKKRTICYFFFRDDYPDQRRSTIALASILRQLLMAQPYLLSDSVLDQVDTDGNKLVQSFRTLWDILMSITANFNSGEIICVMDALDECQEDDRNQLIGAVRNLYLRSNNNRRLKFFLTSRPYGQISDEFQELENQMSTIHLSGEGEAEVEKISHEINLVITKRVQDVGQKKRLKPEESKFLREELTAVVNRTYLWVSLTLNYIERLPGFTKGDFHRKVRDEIPHTVDEAYSKILNGSPDQAKARRLLHTVLAAKRPLSVEELSLAVALKREGQSHDEISDE